MEFKAPTPAYVFEKVEHTQHIKDAYKLELARIVLTSYQHQYVQRKGWTMSGPTERAYATLGTADFLKQFSVHYGCYPYRGMFKQTLDTAVDLFRSFYETATKRTIPRNDFFHYCRQLTLQFKVIYGFDPLTLEYTESVVEFMDNLHYRQAVFGPSVTWEHLCNTSNILNLVRLPIPQWHIPPQTCISFAEPHVITDDYVIVAKALDVAMKQCLYGGMGGKELLTELPEKFIAPNKAPTRCFIMQHQDMTIRLQAILHSEEEARKEEDRVRDAIVDIINGTLDLDESDDDDDLMECVTEMLNSQAVDKRPDPSIMWWLPFNHFALYFFCTTQTH